MKFIETKLKGCFILEPKIIKDERGYFMESFNEKTFSEGVGQKVTFIQDNQSFSSKGVLRGLHYQTGEHAQAKLVRVLQGEVLDVVVDLRPNSPTFGQYESVVLTAENQTQFFIPRGFAHGFLALEDVVLQYKCTGLYNKQSEGGIIWNDKDLNINWGIENPIVSSKDLELPTFEQLKLSGNLF